jgi:hypothetical protein
MTPARAPSTASRTRRRGTTKPQSGFPTTPLRVRLRCDPDLHAASPHAHLELRQSAGGRAPPATPIVASTAPAGHCGQASESAGVLSWSGGIILVRGKRPRHAVPPARIRGRCPHIQVVTQFSSPLSRVISTISSTPTCSGSSGFQSTIIRRASAGSAQVYRCEGSARSGFPPRAPRTQERTPARASVPRLRLSRRCRRHRDEVPSRSPVRRIAVRTRHRSARRGLNRCESASSRWLFETWRGVALRTRTEMKEGEE